jgi:hypothetical protein
MCELGTIESCKAEIERLNQWISNLQQGRVVTCVYCGHAYEPGSGTSQEEVLYEHIKTCPKHPLRTAEERIVVLKQIISDFRKALPDVSEATDEELAQIIIALKALNRPESAIAEAESTARNILSKI